MGMVEYICWVSHGGFVAFEMASRLYEQGCPAASLTLVDTEPPEATLRRIGTSEIFSQFIKVFEDMFDKSLVITQDVIQSGQIQPFIYELHAALIRAKCLPVRSTPEMLQGPLATFAAALQTSYTPAVCYPHKVHLVLVSDKRLDKHSDLKHVKPMLLNGGAQHPIWRFGMGRDTISPFCRTLMSMFWPNGGDKPENSRTIPITCDRPNIAALVHASGLTQL